MRKLLTVFLLLCLNTLPSQNLVINPGFEEYGRAGDFDLTNGFQMSKVKGWYQASGGSSDFYLTGPDRPDEAAFLKRITGPAKPNSGKCFAGFYGASSDYTEYVGGTFAVPLEKGKTYKIGFALQLGALCAIGVSEIGIYLSKDKEVDSKTTKKLRLKPQIRFDSTAQVSLSGKWQIFTAEYVADGKEKYFILGNFTGKTTKIPGSHTNGRAYYLLDDVFCFPSDGESVDLPVAAVPDPPAGSVPVVKVESPSMNPETKTDTIAAGKTLVFRNIYFETDKSVFLPEAYPPLYLILAELKKQPQLKVEIHGHTDIVGSIQHNQQLSEERAKAVADFFIANGIDSSRISSKGFGSSKPVSENDNALNRRVEFVFY